MPDKKTYQPTVESLSSHQVPDWFLDAKFGIFIHWGPYSIPAFAPHKVAIDQIDATDEKQGFANTPYAAWYRNTMLFEGGETARYHNETYGDDYAYENFGDAFNASLSDWDPVSWAKLFRQSGAGYVVLVTKHHDGFALWPSDVENPNQPNWHTERDIVGELAEAVRAEGLKFGVYYSGGVDWTFRHDRIESFVDFMTSMPGQAEGYTDYANAQYRELIERYQPDYLWNDIAYPSAQASFDILAEYYNAVPEGLTNDRWLAPDGQLPPDALDKPEGLTGLLPPKPQVWDVRTPEYGMFDRILPFVWETTRGMGHSFAFNRNETDEDYLSRDDLVSMLARAACFNGNVLLNVGPRWDAMIPPGQAARLEAAGAWLEQAGPSIIATRPVELPEREAGGVPVGATCRGSELFLHVFGQPDSQQLEVGLPDTVRAVTSVNQFGGDVTSWSFESGRLKLDVQDWADSAVQSFRLETQA